LAARDFSRAGETFIDHNNQINEILYSILTPLHYSVHVSAQRLQHMEKMEIRLAGEVVEFIFGPSHRLMFGEEGQPGLEVGRTRKNGKIVAFMCYSLPHLYHRILKGLEEKPIAGKFSVETVDEGVKVTAICDPRVKNATLAEIVQWVWEKYYAPLEATPVGEPAAAEMSA
jgi:hypothetical protein